MTAFAARPAPSPIPPAGGSARPWSRDRRVLACGAVAVLLHLLVLGPVAGSGARPSAGNAGAAGLRSVRLSAVPAMPATAPAVDDRAVQPPARADAVAGMRTAEGSGPEPVARTEAQATASAQAVPHPAQETTTGTAPSSLPVDGSPAASARAGIALADEPRLQGYLPRRQLSRPPQPLAELHIDYPAGSPIGQFSGELVVFVDETGRVRQVRARDARLPASLEEAARQAFHATPFAPGELDGRPVPAMYPVQVSFGVDLPAVARQP